MLAGKGLIIETISKKLESLTLIPEVTSLEKDNITKPEILPSDNVNDTFVVKDSDNDTYQNKEEISFDFDEDNNKESNDEEPRVRIKKMYPVGIAFATYIICENEDGMYIIDQHAAAERVNYEKYFEAMKNKTSNIMNLLIPIKIELPADECILLKKNINILIEQGFDIEEFGHQTFIVRAHPAWLPTYATEEAIKKIINIVIEKEEFDYGKFIEKVAITLACKMSIKANDYVSTEGVEVLLEDLRNTKNPFTCPHGRPTIISYSKYELEKLFKRAMN